MSGPSEAMRAAFPKEELSEGAGRLRDRLESIPARYLSSPELLLAPVIAKVIVTELGITEETVLRLRAGPFITVAEKQAATALATLLEVAGK